MITVHFAIPTDVGWQYVGGTICQVEWRGHTGGQCDQGYSTFMVMLVKPEPWLP